MEGARIQKSKKATYRLITIHQSDMATATEPYAYASCLQCCMRTRDTQEGMQAGEPEPAAASGERESSEEGKKKARAACSWCVRV